MPLDPAQAPQILSNASQLLGEVLRGLPVIAVMWYMLKDLKGTVATIVNEVGDLKLKIASDHNHVKLDHTNEKLKEFKDEQRDQLDEVKARLTVMENQLPKIWSKVGDRPEDIQRRHNGDRK